jgi:hypothetical protein
MSAVKVAPRAVMAASVVPAPAAAPAPPDAVIVVAAACNVVAAVVSVVPAVVKVVPAVVNAAVRIRVGFGCRAEQRAADFVADAAEPCADRRGLEGFLQPGRRGVARRLLQQITNGLQTAPFWPLSARWIVLPRSSAILSLMALALAA